MAWTTDVSSIKIISHEVIIDKDPRLYIKRAEFFDEQDKTETAGDEYDKAIAYSHGAAKYWFEKAKFEKETYTGLSWVYPLLRGILRLARPVWLFLIPMFVLMVIGIVVKPIPIAGEMFFDLQPAIIILIMLIDVLDIIHRLKQGIEIDWRVYGKPWSVIAIIVMYNLVADYFQFSIFRTMQPIAESLYALPGIGSILETLFFIIYLILIISIAAVFLYTAYMSIAMVIDMIAYSINHKNYHVHRPFKNAMPTVAMFALGIFAGYLGARTKSNNNVRL